MPLLIIFIVIPILEIFLFLQVGSLIGVWWTISLVILTAVIGAMLVKSQGKQTLRSIPARLSSDEDPRDVITHGAFILVSAVLLVTPGFFTDAVGFLLLVPAFRDGLIRRMRGRMIVMGGDGGSRTRPARDDVIEGDYTEVDTDLREDNQNSPPSGWTRH